MHPAIRQYSAMDWAVRAADLIQGNIDTVVRQQGHCDVMLTGGRSAKQVYTVLSRLPAFQRMSNVHFYFGDERCVPSDHPDSNYGAAMLTLFAGGLPAGCAAFRMEADDPDREAAALRYGGVLPQKIDILLLGVGDDGHIASLFPGSAALHEAIRRVVPVSGPNPPYDRLTITPSVIRHAKSIFVLAAGVSKAALLSKALQASTDFDDLPARLVINANWLLDSDLPGDHH